MALLTASKETPQLSAGQARSLMIAAQGLASEPTQPVDRLDILECIRAMGALQIDTIHVVARSPYLVLWSRLGHYDPALLDGLLASGELFEYWAHEACMLPIEDYPLYRRLMLERRKGWRPLWKWLDENAELAAQMIAHIGSTGPVRSSDFARTDGRKSGGWWDWKAEKVALDVLHTNGDLMIARRERFQRIYDLRSRILPAWEDAMAPPYEEVVRSFTRKAVRSLGLALPGWVADYYRLPKPDVAKAVKALESDGELVPVRVEGWAEEALVHREDRGMLESAESGELSASRTTILSPFDPLVWDRNRVRAAFDFDYTIECYVPEAKRKFGYFVLPILHRDRLVGRMDAKAHRKEGRMQIKVLYLEEGVEPDEELLSGLTQAIGEFARWHGTPEVVIDRTEPASLKRKLKFSKRRPGKSRIPR